MVPSQRTGVKVGTHVICCVVVSGEGAVVCFLVLRWEYRLSAVFLGRSTACVSTTVGCSSQTAPKKNVGSHGLLHMPAALRCASLVSCYGVFLVCLCRLAFQRLERFDVVRHFVLPQRRGPTKVMLQMGKACCLWAREEAPRFRTCIFSKRVGCFVCGFAAVVNL